MNDINIRTFPVNPLGVNLYVISNFTNDAIVIDPGCASLQECETIFKYTKDEGLNVKHIICTHPHFDHIMGAKWICEHYNLPLSIHESVADCLPVYMKSAAMYGFAVGNAPTNINRIKEGNIIEFGANKLKVLYTPGHCEGSICLVYEEYKNVFTGDVLFRDSIGRTDLPGGDFDLLISNIKTKLLTLGNDYTVRPGHGGRSTVGYERENNPFIM